MKKNLVNLLLMCFIILGFKNLDAQKISDGQTLNFNGLAVTFNILNKEKIESQGKTYDRYKVSASVHNTTEKSFNIRLNTFPQVNSSNKIIAEINCINATGARLTSKKIQLNLKPHILNVTYYSYDKNGKYVSSLMPVTAGYYLDPGDKVEETAIFIVPKGESLDVSVRSMF